MEENKFNIAEVGQGTRRRVKGMGIGAKGARDEECPEGWRNKQCPRRDGGINNVLGGVRGSSRCGETLLSWILL